MDRSRQALARTLAPAVVATTVFLLIVALYLLSAPRFSASLLTVWGAHPFRFPFLDADTVMSALRCRRLGIDVFDVNPCDALGRVYDYSPLWLYASVFPFTEAWIVPVGLAIAVLFLASLLLLPPGRDGTRTGLIIAGVLSTPVVFAVERANNDVIIFVLACLAATLTLRSPAWRWLGYGCALLAGLLKYYPMMLLVIAVRERPRMFFAVAATATLLLALFIATSLEPLRRALSLIPTGSFFGDMFGARTLAFGLAELTGAPPAMARVGEWGLDLAAIGVGAWLSLRGWVDDDLAALTERERSFLFAGALLVLGCFLTAQNIGYRALHLVLVLPALTALAGRRRIWTAGVGIVLVLLWAEGWRHWLDAAVEGRPPWADLPLAVDGPRVLGWLVREACWWSVVTLLWACVITFLRQSTMMRALLPLRRRPTGLSPAPHPPRPRRAR